MTRVLIVDDLISIHEMLEAVIQPTGFATSFATDGEKALAQRQAEQLRDHAPRLLGWWQHVARPLRADEARHVALRDGECPARCRPRRAQRHHRRRRATRYRAG